jgi:hypothetical protein
MLGREPTIDKSITHRAGCQVYFLKQMAEPLGLPDVLWQRRNRLRRFLKRRWNFVISFFAEKNNLTKGLVEGRRNNCAVGTLKPGDLVRIRSKDEVKNTLNRWNQLKGCAFTEEMWPYCGTTQKVLKRMEKFLDERDYLMKRCKGIVILDGIFCEGTKDFGACDRSCYYFWREEWLRKID